MKSFKPAFLFVLLSFTASAAGAANYFVSSAGINTNDGRRPRGKRSMAKY